MKLKIKFLDWSAGLPVSIISNNAARKIGISIKDRILIKKGKSEFTSIVDISSDIVKKDELAVSSELRDRLKLKEGDLVSVEYSPAADSMVYIKQKLEGKKLSKKKIFKIIEEVVNNSLSEAEIAVFVSAMYSQGMHISETISLIHAILATGNKLNINKKYVVDKHCIGGIPGNRTTPIVVAICVAAGLTMPKFSSRAITSAAGTADTIEVLANVDFSIKKVESIVKKTGGCMVWGGGIGMVPADSKIIKIEKMLNMDPEAQLLASIMSKKLAADSDYILIDIPYGKNAKVSKGKAIALAKKFKLLGKGFKKKMIVVLTKGDEPIGNGIGPSLEAEDLVKVLSKAVGYPKDLEKKSIFLAGKILEMTKKAKKNRGDEMARNILDSGDAYKKFEEIIKAQGGSLENIKRAKFKKDIFATKVCKVKSIHNKKMNSLARVAGCPSDKTAGIYLNCHVGIKLKRGDKIMTLYSQSKSKLGITYDFYKKTKPITFS